MNYMMKIIHINAYIQRSMGKILLDGKEVLCVSLDRTCTFEGEDEGDMVLDDDQLESLLDQTYTPSEVVE